MTLLPLWLLRAWTQLNIGFSLGLLAWLLNLSPLAHAHGSAVGDLHIDHPYAVPSAPGATVGHAYLRGIRNEGHHLDRLLSAETPVAAAVQLHRLGPGGHELADSQVQAIELLPNTTVRLCHTGDYQLRLINLKAALRDGDRFDLTLHFERAGAKTVQVWVQTPRAAQAAHSY